MNNIILNILKLKKYFCNQDKKVEDEKIAIDLQFSFLLH